MWFSYLYRSISNGDRSKSLWNQYQNGSGGEYLKSTLNVVGGLRVGTEVLVPMFTHDHDNEPQKYLLSPGTIPWFTGLVFVEDQSLGESLHRLLESQPDDTAATKDMKNILRAAVLTITGKLDRMSEGLTQAYSDPKKAVSIVKRLFQNIGLTVKHTGRKSSVDGERKNQKTIQFRVVEFALILGMKRKSWADNFLEILPPCMSTQNLCEEDKELIRDAVALHNRCCVQTGVPEPKIILPNTSPSNRFTGIVPYRTHDARVEREVRMATGTYVSPEQEARERIEEREVGEVLATMYQRVERDDEVMRRNQDRRRREAAASIPEPDFEMEEDMNQPTGREHRKRTRCMFIDDEAVETNDD